MKLQSINSWCWLMFLVIIVSSCLEPTENLDTINANLTASASLPLPSDTPTSIPIPAQVLIPTLSYQKAEVELLNKLSTNDNCKLPCVWGIVPMKSSFSDAQRILLPLSILSDIVFWDLPEVGNISPRYREGNLEIYTSIAVLANPENEIVKRITFRAEAHRPLVVESGYENIFDSSVFGEKAAAYMLSHVLFEQGIPESVMISTSGGPLTRGGTGGFDIALLYPRQGVFVNYTTQINFVGNNVRGCPQNAHVLMELFAPGDTENFFAQLENTDWTYIKNGFKPLVEATTMTVEEFYETFSEQTDKCLETPAGLWPIPEP